MQDQFPFTVWDVLGAVAQQLPVVFAVFWGAMSPLARFGLVALVVWSVVKPSPQAGAVTEPHRRRYRRRRRRRQDWEW